MENNQDGSKAPTAFLVDLVSNRKIPIATPRCRVGRDDLNDIVISGDQSISRFHFIISYENGEFTVQDAKSRHGTFLNGNQLTVAEPIKDGDVLKVGVSLFWFVVEGVQGEATDPSMPAGKVTAITDDEKAAAADNAVTVKTGAEIEASGKSSNRSQEMTQEMKRPDPALLEKLEAAAKAEDKKEEQPKTSLASLLADARAAEEPAEPEMDKKKEELAALAAKDKELLEEVEAQKDDEEAAEPAETTEEEAEEPEEKNEKEEEKSELEMQAEVPAQDSSELTEDTLPNKPVNKPSDTVTLEALTPSVSAKAKDKEEEEVVESAAEEENPRATEEESPKAADEMEDFAPEAVAKETEAEIKASNAGIIDSEPETREEDSRDKAAAESKSPGEIQIPFSLPPASGGTGASSGADSGSNGAGSTKRGGEEAGSIRPTLAMTDSDDLDVTKFIKAGASVVPDWCKRYFSDEIAKLNNELDELNEQVKIAQQKIRDVETRVALTRGIRNTLLTTTGDELVEACGKVLSLLGWKVTLTAEDKHELRLEVEDKHVCIARVIWTTTKAERSHLGQLSISQTRYWMEKGIEPKGIIIVSKISNDAPTNVGESPEEIELNDYAAKRNVCLMSTLQLLSLYKEIALSDANPDKLRTAIVNASGWLAGHALEPGTADVNEDDGSGSASSKLAAASA